MESVVVLTLSLKNKIKQGQKKLNYLLNNVLGMDTFVLHKKIVTGTYITKIH